MSLYVKPFHLQTCAGGRGPLLILLYRHVTSADPLDLISELALPLICHEVAWVQG